MSFCKGGSRISVMASRLQYIRSRTDYLAFRHSDSVIRSGHFVVLCLRDAEPFSFSVGITIRKGIGIAVLRNRLKRRIKACLRSLDLSGIRGWKINFIAQPNAASLDWLTLTAEVTWILEELSRKS